MSNVVILTHEQESSEFESLELALQSTVSGDSLQLIDDTSLDSSIIISGLDVVLDLNGHTIEGNFKEPLISIYGSGTLTVEDSSSDKTGKLINNAYIGVAVGTSSDFSSKNSFILNSGNIEAQEFGVIAFGCGDIVVNDGTIIGKDNAGIGSNGSAKYSDYPYTITINGGVIEGRTESEGYANCGLYAANAGIVNINGGTIKGVDGAGIVIRSGSVNVTGGTITGSGTSSGLRMGDANPTFCGGIEVCNSTNYPGKLGICSISGGSIVSVSSDALLVIGDPSSSSNPNSSESKVVVSGGTFEGQSAIRYVDAQGEEFSEVKSANVSVVSGNFSSDISKYLDDSITLKTVLKSDGTCIYIADDRIASILEDTDSLLSSSSRLEGLASKTVDVVSNISEEQAKTQNTVNQISTKVDNANTKLENVKSKLSTISSLTSSIKSTQETIKTKADSIDITSKDIQNTTSGIKTDTSGIKTDTANIKEIVDSINSSSKALVQAAESIYNVEKKLLQEVAKLYGDDPSDVIEGAEEKTYDSILLLQLKAAVKTAKVTGESKALWQHEMTEVLKEWCDGQGYKISRFIAPNPSANVGDQWLILF